MAKNQGFTLIELVVFIIILGIICGTILVGIFVTLRYYPLSHSQTVATTTSAGCMDYILGQRALKGFNFNGQPCPGGGDDTSVPAFCTSNTPSGYTTSVVIKCATVPIPGTQEFKLVTVTTSGPASGKVELKSLIANY